MINIRVNAVFSDTMKPKSITIEIDTPDEQHAIEAAKRAAYAALLHGEPPGNPPSTARG